MKRTFLIYLIGISGSGKTTIATALSQKLKEYNLKHQLIDGDVIRSELGDIFGFTFEERMKCNQVVRTVTKYLLKNDIPVILAQVGAYQLMRDYVHEVGGDDYIEVYVKCSVEECIRRDVKGYYKDPTKKLTKNFNGVYDVFEEPLNCNIIIDTEHMSINESVDKIIGYLKTFGYLLENK